jgi:hypothetical protein
VPQFVQYDAAENQHDEEDCEKSSRQVMAVPPIGDNNESHEQKESGVHVNVDSRQPPDLP